ncbi:cell division protein FtsQ [soil metagenome]
MVIKTKVRKALILTVWILSFGTAFVLLSFVNQKQLELRCDHVEINIDDAVAHEFIDQKDILELVNSKGKVVGKPLGAINTMLLEKIILTNPFVSRAEVYSSIDGNLHVDIWQRDPVVRIINMHDEQFYIDREGKFMPVSDHYTPPAIVANGYIFNAYAEMKVVEAVAVTDTLQTDSLQVPRMINQVYALATFLEADTFWSANTEQIYVNEQQELEVIPRVGNHRILIGDTTDLNNKFSRLMTFYKQGLNKTGWNNYNVINLKFRDQVVCSKIK